MANYFFGESHNAKVTVTFKDLTPLKKLLSVLLFVLWIPFAAFLFVPGLFQLGVAGLIAYGIYIPAACIYIANLRGRQRIAPYILIAIGVLGEAGYLLVSAYLQTHKFTVQLLVAVVCIPIFLGFFIPGICILVIGIKRNKKWKTYSRTVMATVTEYKAIATKLIGEVAPGIHNPINGTKIYSPILQYELDGKTYRAESDSYFGKSQLPPVGQQLEIHVNPANPNDYIMVLYQRGMLIAGGIAFLAVSLLDLAMAAAALTLF